MAESVIKWKKGDYVKLGRAVALFNRTISEHQTLENKLYLPDEVEYKEIKSKITTRKELNRVLNSLRRITNENAFELYETTAGEIFTNWERRELSIQRGIATRRLQAELKELNKPLENGYSRVQMGSVRAKEIEAQIKNLETFETKKGYELERLVRRIRNIGVSDYGMRKAIVYRENYFEMLKTYENYDNYDKLINVLSQITNPIEFYNFVSQNELLADITFMYDMNMNFRNNKYE